MALPGRWSWIHELEGALPVNAFNSVARFVYGPYQARAYGASGGRAIEEREMASESLQSIMETADRGQVVLPDFQRDFVWKPPDVIKLISSLLNRYPIGGLLLMENAGVYGFRPLDGAPDSSDPNKEVILILDGQQRLTSCYRAFYGAMADDLRYVGRYYFNY